MVLINEPINRQFVRYEEIIMYQESLIEAAINQYKFAHHHSSLGYAAMMISIEHTKGGWIAVLGSFPSAGWYLRFERNL